MLQSSSREATTTRATLNVRLDQPQRHCPAAKDGHIRDVSYHGIAVLTDGRGRKPPDSTMSRLLAIIVSEAPQSSHRRHCTYWWILSQPANIRLKCREVENTRTSTRVFKASHYSRMTRTNKSAELATGDFGRRCRHIESRHPLWIW